MNNKKNTKEKGITLIALVITIIIMLILAAVTINIAINGGLINYARNAKDETIKEQEKETIALVLAEWGILRNQDFVDFFKSEFGEENVVDNSNDTITVTIEKTGNKYIVSKNGNIEYTNGEENPPEPELTEYTIIYYKNDGTDTIYEQTAIEGEETTLSTNTFIRDWYRLEGWYANPECTGDKITSVTENAEVYANWKVDKTIVFNDSYNGEYTVTGGTVGVNTSQGMYPTSYPVDNTNTYVQNVVYIDTGTINLGSKFEFISDLYFNNSTVEQGGVIGVYLANTSNDNTRYIALRDSTNSYLQMRPTFRFKSGSSNIFDATGDTYNTYGTSFNGTMRITGNGTNMYGYLNNSQVTSMQLNGDFTFDQIWIQFTKYNNCDTIPMGVKQITIRELD